MNYTLLSPRALLLLMLAVSIAGCASREVLQPYSADNAANVDFSGEWQLREDPADMERRIQAAIRATDDLPDGIFVRPMQDRNRRSSDSGRASGGLVHVFFETGRSLKITQTPAGLFLSFDRAVVEEFRFGEARQISVGQAEAMRVSGWDGASYVVETLGRNGMKLTERYRLSADRQLLTRRIVFRSKDRETAEVVQTFARRAR